MDALEGKTVVICEDEWATTNILTMILSKVGLNVVGVVADGESCVSEVLLKKPDLVLIDINLPQKMDGAEAARQILSTSEATRPVVIMITAYGDEKHRQEALDAGVNGYVVKPFQPRELLEYIRFVMEAETNAKDAALAAVKPAPPLKH